MKGDSLQLTIGSVFIEHERTASLHLRIQYSVPQHLCFDSLPRSSLGFILRKECLELFSPYVMEARSFIRAEQRPVLISLDSLHAVHELISVSRRVTENLTIGLESRGHKRDHGHELVLCRGSYEGRETRKHPRAKAQCR